MVPIISYLIVIIRGFGMLQKLSENKALQKMSTGNMDYIIG
jgi:hypothetical protein